MGCWKLVRVKVGFNHSLCKFSDLLSQMTPWHESVPHISELAGESHKVAALSRRQTSVRICHKRYNEVWSRLPERRESNDGESEERKKKTEGREREWPSLVKVNDQPCQRERSVWQVQRSIWGLLSAACQRGSRSEWIRISKWASVPKVQLLLLLHLWPHQWCNALVVLQL